MYILENSKEENCPAGGATNMLTVSSSMGKAPNQKKKKKRKKKKRKKKKKKRKSGSCVWY